MKLSRGGVAVDQDGTTKAGMGVTSVDYDDDADLDILVVNLSQQTDSFFRNQGGYFSDQTRGAGLAIESRQFTRFGVGFADFDNDGWLDLLQANGRVTRETQRHSEDIYAEPRLLFRGTPEGGFEEVKPHAGTLRATVATSRAAVFGDIDNDGGIDVLVVNCDSPVFLLSNVVEKRGHWIQFRIIDNHARDAFGAIVSLTMGDRRVQRIVQSAYSYLASNDPRVHFGTSDEGRIHDVEVQWPDGIVESFGDFDVGQIVTLSYGTGKGHK